MAKLTKICVHWTAGTNQPNSTDYQHYHYLINGDGLIFKGKYKPEDNLDCNDCKYCCCFLHIHTTHQTSDE